MADRFAAESDSWDQGESDQRLHAFTSGARLESGFFALPGSWRKASDPPQQRKSDLGDSGNNGRAGLVFISDTGRETCVAGSMVTTPPFLHKGNPSQHRRLAYFPFLPFDVKSFRISGIRLILTTSLS